jgi:hypothetical protein
VRVIVGYRLYTRRSFGVVQATATSRSYHERQVRVAFTQIARSTSTATTVLRTTQRARLDVRCNTGHVRTSATDAFIRAEDAELEQLIAALVAL